MLTHLWKLTYTRQQRKTADGLFPICKGILAQSFSCNKLSNQKPTANTVRSQYKKQDKITSIYQSYCVFSLLFSQKISTKHDITSTEISYQFLALKVPVLGRNKAADSSTSTDPFSTATKILVLANLFKFERFAITFERAFCHWG